MIKGDYLCKKHGIVTVTTFYFKYDKVQICSKCLEDHPRRLADTFPKVQSIADQDIVEHGGKTFRLADKGYGYSAWVEVPEDKCYGSSVWVEVSEDD